MLAQIVGSGDPRFNTSKIESEEVRPYVCEVWGGGTHIGTILFDFEHQCVPIEVFYYYARKIVEKIRKHVVQSVKTEYDI